ncbi:hypothetical protein XELAEV_180071212mg, partial [Xenopus laevis]
MNWVLQIPGKGLQWVGGINPNNGNTDFTSSFKGRFTITKDNSI